MQCNAMQCKVMQCVMESNASKLQSQTFHWPAFLHCPRSSMSKDGLADPKHHGSEVRIGPAASSPYCQTLLSELPRNESQTFHSPAFLHCPRSSAQRTVSQSQNTMAVKYGSGPRPAAHCAKRCQRMVSQSQNTMAVKYGSSPQPPAHCAKLCFLNCLGTNLRPSIRPPSCTASEAPCQRTVSQSQNTMAVKYGSSPRPAAHTAKRCFLNCLGLDTSLRRSLRPPSCTAREAPSMSKDGLAEPKHHGSEVRLEPAAGSPNCQTLLSELPRN